jgi:hypothetical protein
VNFKLLVVFLLSSGTRAAGEIKQEHAAKDA